jgi:riboflavin kinase/FMN adenylyltransferase
MQTWTSPAELTANFGNSAVTIGKFDGLHLGHQALLNELKSTAANNRLKSVAITFDRHPDALLNPERAKLPLIGSSQKNQLFQSTGIDLLLNLPFDRALAELTAEDFVTQILVKALNAKVVIVGEGFRFGKSGLGTADTLRQLGEVHGFTVTVIAPVTVDGHKVSTTRIREMLDLGDVAGAAKLLGRVHKTTGEIEHGLKIGRTIGFPTANMSRDAEGYLPVDGVYAGWLVTAEERFPTALSVGINETFQAVPRLVEGYVLDRTDLDLYGQIVDFEYVDFVRATAKFDGVEALIDAINRDVARVRTILS